VQLIAPAAVLVEHRRDRRLRSDERRDAAFCVIDVTFEVEWLWIADDARSPRPAELPAAAPAGHRVRLRRRPAQHRLLAARLGQHLGRLCGTSS
jgi:hypothetical protein